MPLPPQWSLPPPSPPEREWTRTPSTGDLLVFASAANAPRRALDYTVTAPPHWQRWVDSTWVCTAATGDWKSFLYAQGIGFFLVEAMAVTNYGIGSQLKVHTKSPAEMHFEAFMVGLPSVPGVDMHQWQHYYFDWAPYVSSIPMGDDQSWQGTWLVDGTQWMVMSGRNKAWQYHSHQGLSADGMEFWSHATIQPQNITVGRTFRRLGNLTSDELHQLQGGGVSPAMAAALIVAAMALGSACYAFSTAKRPLPTMN